MFNAERGLLTNPEPPDDDVYITADCGCEIYKGWEIFEWEGRTYCAECFEDAIDELSLDELAEKLGATIRTIGAIEKGVE